MIINKYPIIVDEPISTKGRTTNVGETIDKVNLKTLFFQIIN